MSNLTRRLAGIGVAALLVSGALSASPASALTGPISGSTAWSNCSSYSVSNNVRYTTAANKQVRVNINSAGKLGVKIYSQNVNTGAISPVRYFPPLGSYQNLGKYSTKNTPFRLAFSCVNERAWNENPSTNFSGSLDY